ncbi:MAG: fumarylacetoacetate hydrolase family protein [Hydrogenophilaceae bacterium]|nr:fumarylacetoacetate hydrolase family protein [Hydrogenophilaceae bacterium]
MAYWIRFAHAGKSQIGTLEADTISVHSGELFADARPTGVSLPLSAVKLLTPVIPGKLIGLWNNFHERAKAEGLSKPEHPLYFIKPDTCYLAEGETIRRPAGYAGKIVFEGELGVVIGKTCRGVSAAEAGAYIFGYTCVNDVTARDILKCDPSFVQWSRAKGYDSFGPFGPGIRTEVDPSSLSVRVLVNGAEKQNYPVADMFYGPHEIVSRLSHDMTLNPGDIISCGTSSGAGPILAGDSVQVVIDGVGTLTNPVA